MHNSKSHMSLFPRVIHSDFRTGERLLYRQLMECLFRLEVLRNWQLTSLNSCRGRIHPQNTR